MKLYRFFSFCIVKSVIEKVINSISVLMEINELEVKCWDVIVRSVVIEKMVIIGV